MIEHNEHFDGICEKTISRASGFINNGLLTNFKKIYIVHYKSKVFGSDLRSDDSIKRIEEITIKYKNYLKEKTIELIDFSNLIDFNNFYSLKNTIIKKEVYEKSTLCIFINSNFIVRTDFLPKIIQYINFLIYRDKKDDFILRSDTFITNNSGGLIAALDGETIPKLPFLSNPFRAIIALSLDKLITINIDKLINQKNHLGLAILSYLKNKFHIFSLPSILCKLNLNEVEINNYAESFLYGLTKEEANFLEKIYKNIPLISNQIEKVKNKNLSFSYSLNYDTKSSNFEDKNIKIFSITPFKNNLEITLNCIKHFKNSKINVDLRTVLIDNGSEKNNLIKRIKDESDYYLYSKEAYNFSYLNNIGFSLIEKDLDLKNDFVLLLNNDCLIFEDALEKLLAAINISKSISAAGGKLFYEDRKIQHGGVAITRKKAYYAPHKLYHIDAHKNSEDSISSKYSFFADGCTAACLLIKASDYKKINGFKSDVCPSAHSDSYLYNSIRKLGKYIIYQPKAEGIHYESYSRTFYYPDDIESYISFNLLNSDTNKGLLSKEVVNFN